MDKDRGLPKVKEARFARQIIRPWEINALKGVISLRRRTSRK